MIGNISRLLRCQQEEATERRRKQSHEKAVKQHNGRKAAMAHLPYAAWRHWNTTGELASILVEKAGSSTGNFLLPSAKEEEEEAILLFPVLRAFCISWPYLHSIINRFMPYLGRDENNPGNAQHLDRRSNSPGSPTDEAAAEMDRSKLHAVLKLASEASRSNKAVPLNPEEKKKKVLHLRDVITVSHKTIKNCFRNLLTSELHVGCSSAKIQSTNIPQKSYENLLLGSGNRPWPAPIINVTLVECSRLPSYYCSSIANRKYPTQHLFIRRFLVNHQLYSNHQILSQLFAEESGSSQQETTFLIRRDIEIFISPPIPSPQIRFTSFQPLFFSFVVNPHLLQNTCNCLITECKR